MYPQHLLHAKNCAAPDQSMQAITSLTKFINLASRGQRPELIAPIILCAILNCIDEVERWDPSHRCREVIRRLIAKCIARESNSEASELFKTKQLGVAVKAGAENVVHATRIAKIKEAGILQIDFKNALILVKRSKVLVAVDKFSPSGAPFATFRLLTTVICVLTTHI